jgi:hypothetical protein
MNLAMMIFGLAFSLTVLLLTIRQQRSFSKSDVGAVASAFLAGRSVPVAAFLIWYGFSPDPQSVATKLRTYEFYVAFAGFIFFIATLATLWDLVTTARKTKDEDKPSTT